ncbi:MAG: ParB N-terminal domain-containing protein [Candidatus Limiplasma sp.]|nr:ParB N-terminal domain-containing protein [Candidatus Limiplasma sp.]
MQSQVKLIPVEQLEFDTENPRLPTSLHHVNDDRKIFKYMLRDESLIELMTSIAESGYFDSEPLLAIKNGDKYTVVEGNRRLAALKLLLDPSLATTRNKSVAIAAQEKKCDVKNVPVIIYNKRDDILDYLGYRHITGTKSWGALEKARYLRQLCNRHHASSDGAINYSNIAKMIGSSTSYVGKLLAALMLYDYANERAYFSIDIDEDSFEFSILSTAIGFENIYKFIGLESAKDTDEAHVNGENYSFIFRKLYDPREKIADSRQIGSLNAVLGNTLALTEYKRTGSLSDAILFTSAPVETFEKLLDVCMKALQSAKGSLESLPANDASRILELVGQIDSIKRTILIIEAGLNAIAKNGNY